MRPPGAGLGPGDFAAINPAATYRLVTNSFLAGGGDGLTALKQAQGARVDTGFLEHDVLAEHLKSLGTVRPPALRRVVVKSGQGARVGSGVTEIMEIPAQRPPVAAVKALGLGLRPGLKWAEWGWPHGGWLNRAARV
ncbi:MAG: hypothetical protein C0405_15125 [Desulfovibrio sp.]|nr:hypothetical protein [Desulfovibrio sp.]